MRNLITFLETKTPMNRAKAEKVLAAQVRVNGGVVMTRQALIEMRIEEGSFISLISGEKVLKNKDGSFAIGADYTKTAIDYAEHLAGDLWDAV